MLNKLVSNRRCFAVNDTGRGHSFHPQLLDSCRCIWALSYRGEAGKCGSRYAAATRRSEHPIVSDDNGSALLWKELYGAAKVELDPAKLPQRIDDARYAILDRIADRFSTKSSDKEQVELRVALEALNFLHDRTTCRS
jgi:hypothetical protein